MAMKKKVLVLDGDMTPALTVARSLARAGLHVDIASHIDKPLAGYSRHTRLQLGYPNPLESPQLFIDWLKAHAANDTYELVIPVTERTAVPIHRQRDQISDINVALPEHDSLEVALDKAKTVELALQLGIPVPESRSISQNNRHPYDENMLPYPVVIKPARSMGAEDKGIIQLSVDYAFDHAELTAKTTHALRFGDVILQAYFKGQGVGVELITDHGKIIYAFQHLRLHEVPLTGGGSSLRKSVAVEPELLAASQKLMASLNWHGVAMVEFKWNPETRDFRLMEINGRFWGSLPLAVSAGADFPAMLYELLSQGHVTQRPPARLGMYGQKISSDLYWYEQVMRRNAPEKLVTLPTSSSLLRDALLIFSPRHRFDIQQWGDPLPGLIDLWQIAANYIDRIRQLLSARVFAWRQRRAWSDGEIGTRLRTAGHILFVCYGNINRSALAGNYFSTKTAGMAIASESAGFHAQAGRPADPNMTELAKTKGINLEAQRSRSLDHAMVGTADLIFVMEKKHYDKIAMDYPAATNKTFLLSPCGEIDDPYGKSTAVYKHCLDEVTNSVDTLTMLLFKAKNT
jgi:protein-tyrosine-phosphatase/predicted ATP-grasp superfamily ATP-dependent carboligase